MSWGKFLQPDLVLGNSLLSLTPEILKQYQLEGLVLDVDDTLLPMKSSQMCPRLQQQVAQLKDVATIWLVSNNINESRIGAIARALDVPYLAFAGKPFRGKLRQAVAAMNLPPERVGMVGDRLFTDVLAGNRLGMFTILVEPIVEPGKVASNSTVRAIEVWFSQALGVSLGVNK